MGLGELGAGRPIGPALPPGRWLGLGGTCTSSLASHLQCVLPIRWQPNRSRGHYTGSLSARVSNARELSFGTWGVYDVDDQRNQESADRSLSPNQTGPADRLTGRCHAGGGKQRVRGEAAGSASALERVEWTGSKRTDQTFAGVARGGHSERFATTGICPNSGSIGRTGRDGKVSDQSRADRIGKDSAENGSAAVMKTGRRARNLVIVRAAVSLPVGVEL
jgi:hypothetical protein